MTARQMTRRTLIVLAVALAAAVAGMVIDDARFWLRYLARVPALVGVTDSAGANAIPATRAIIVGHPGAPLPRCAASPEAAAAFARADVWLKTRKTEAFVVLHRDCLVHERYFSGDAASARPAGAMAKSLMALLAGRALREGMIAGLDAPVAGQLPEWRHDPRSAIRYRDLLTMHAGLDWYRQSPSPFSKFQRIILASDYPQYALGIKAIAPPGRTYDYSAWTFDVLGISLARAARQPYEAMVSQLLSQPLGLSDMRIYVDRPAGTVHGNCCLFTRADDWARLGALLVHESRRPALLPAGFVSAMATPSPDQPAYGMGVWLGSPYRPVRKIASARNPYPSPVQSVIRQSEPFVANDVLIFEGVGQNKVWIVPSRELVIVRMGKAPADWDDDAIPNLLLKALK